MSITTLPLWLSRMDWRPFRRGVGTCVATQFLPQAPCCRTMGCQPHRSRIQLINQPPRPTASSPSTTSPPDVLRKLRYRQHPGLAIVRQPQAAQRGRQLRQVKAAEAAQGQDGQLL